ncbi:MAG: NAD-dependent epimerase/dehydratase family protein [Patescibacteria group bacterium]
MKKVLITGATGYLGNHVINFILKQIPDINVIATSTNLDKARKFSWYPKVEYIECDLEKKKNNFFSFFKKPDLLIHLAWANVHSYQDQLQITKNLPNNYAFLENIINHGLRDLAVAGTCFEYGLAQGCLSEKHKAKPVTVYAQAKYLLYKKLTNLQKEAGFTFRWLRIFYNYGEGQYYKSIIPLLDKAIIDHKEVFDMSGGDQLRDYLPVEKMAEQIVLASLQNKINGIVNCCSGKPITVRKLVQGYLKKRGGGIKLNFGYYPYLKHEPMAFWGSREKIDRILKLYKRSL